MAEQGCGPVRAVMSDNARCYSTSHQFRDTLAQLGARHILIPPRTPKRNGKVCVSRSAGRPRWRRGSPRLSV
jgi:transposase InsO family protein